MLARLFLFFRSALLRVVLFPCVFEVLVFRVVNCQLLTRGGCICFATIIVTSIDIVAILRMSIGVCMFFF